MIDYISRWDAISVLNELIHKKPEYYEMPLYNAIAAIQAIPAADVRENVPARWERGPWGEDTLGPLHCSNCGGWGSPNYKFCPNCGAKMEG